jgi:hypothetical protein
MSTFRRYLYVQLVTFVVGIIGPLFLIMYFASQPDPSMKPMYWIGLFVTAADVLIALVVTDYLGRAKRGKKSAERPDQSRHSTTS